MTPISLTRRAVARSTVYCKVDDSSGPIAPGDLLIPSTTTFGHAMRAAHGSIESAVIGEALAPFDGGCGLIRIAVTAEQTAVLRNQVTKANRRKSLLNRLLDHC